MTTETDKLMKDLEELQTKIENMKNKHKEEIEDIIQKYQKDGKLSLESFKTKVENEKRRMCEEFESQISTLKTKNEHLISRIKEEYEKKIKENQKEISNLNDEIIRIKELMQNQINDLNAKCKLLENDSNTVR